MCHLHNRGFTVSFITVSTLLTETSKGLCFGTALYWAENWTLRKVNPKCIKVLKKDGEDQLVRSCEILKKFYMESVKIKLTELVTAFVGTTF